ncbi:DNA helicase HerA-like ATPase [Amorphus sp. MBR-141]
MPDDISLVGYNDIPLVSRLPTPLTSVRVPFDQIATSALELLELGADRRGDRLRIATPSLIPGRSASPLKPAFPLSLVVSRPRAMELLDALVGKPALLQHPIIEAVEGRSARSG